MDFLSSLIGAAGNIATAQISANAIQNATQTQIDAINRQKQWVFDQLNPATVGAQATLADAQRARARLLLQGQIDPQLLQQRYASEADISKRAGELGTGNEAAVANAAATEALNQTPGFQAAKKGLIDAALKHLSEGATLPPDVQAEFVKAGLEQSGMVTGAAGGRGVGGTILRTVLGNAGLQLQAQREKQAQELVTTASNLDAQRQNILQGLFPKLAQTQLANLGAQQAVLQQSDAMVPQAGLGGTDIANIWLARVGATNALTQSAANAASQSQMALGNVYGNLAGGLTQAAGRAVPSISSWFNSSSPASSAPSDSGDYGGEL